MFGGYDRSSERAFVVLKNSSGAFLIVFFLATSTGSATTAHSVQRGHIQANGLSAKQAKEVLIVALKNNKFNLRKSGVFIENLVDDKGKPYRPGHFEFSLGYSDPNAGAIEYWGMYSVSALTGDVWETHTCENFSFPELQRVQREIMTITKKTFDSERVARRGFGCTD